jgi:hypothetical protein
MHAALEGLKKRDSQLIDKKHSCESNPVIMLAMNGARQGRGGSHCRRIRTNGLILYGYDIGIVCINFVVVDQFSHRRV